MEIHPEFIVRCYGRGCPAAAPQCLHNNPALYRQGHSGAVKHRCYAKLPQVGLVETDEPGLAERDTELVIKHGLEYGPG